MSVYAEQIKQYEYDMQKKKELMIRLDNARKEYAKHYDKYTLMLEAQSILGTVSDEHTQSILEYITGVINNALAKMFPYDKRSICLTKTLYRGTHTHINVTLRTSNGKERDLTLQAGTGLRQIISVLYMIAITVVTKSRKLIIADELMNGLHPNAKAIVRDILQIFAEAGFQFIFVEYGIDNLGKVYLVEKPDSVATVTYLGTEYNNETFVFNKPVDAMEEVTDTEDVADTDTAEVAEVAVE